MTRVIDLVVHVVHRTSSSTRPSTRLSALHSCLHSCFHSCLACSVQRKKMGGQTLGLVLVAVCLGSGAGFVGPGVSLVCPRHDAFGNGDVTHSRLSWRLVSAFSSHGNKWSVKRLAMSSQTPETPPTALRTLFSPPWACITGCGACCWLAPAERDLEPLSLSDRELYTSMAADDGEYRETGAAPPAF